MSLFEMLFDDPDDRRTVTARQLNRLVSQNAELRVDAVCAISVLAQENDRLRLYCAALARLLLKKGLVSLDEITEMIDGVDPEDGFVDGKLKGRPLPGENPRHRAKTTIGQKPVGKVPKPPTQPLAKPPKGWKPKAPAGSP